MVANIFTKSFSELKFQFCKDDFGACNQHPIHKMFDEKQEFSKRLCWHKLELTHKTLNYLYCFK